MIKEIKLTNFYSFHQETIKIEPDVNILVGINGSGKSNFLKAIHLLKEGVAGVGLRSHIFDTLGGFDNIFYKGNIADNEKYIEIDYIFDGAAIAKGNYGFHFTDDLRYRIRITKTPSLQNYSVQEHIETVKNESESGFIYLDFNAGIGILHEAKDKRGNPVKYSDFNPQELVLKEVSDTDRYFALTTIRKAIKDIFVYDYFDTTPKSLIRKPMMPSSDGRLLPDGTNLPQVLNILKINNKNSYTKIVSILNEVNNKFRGFDFFNIGGNIELMLDEDGLDSSIHVSNISDGTLRYLCLLAILYNPERGKFLCIDEPEVGLHPDMISNIAKAITYASEQSTIVIATHSENLLNCFELENIRVFEKDNQNSTKISIFSKTDFEGWYENFVPGNMWRAGDIGGNRW